MNHSDIVRRIAAGAGMGDQRHLLAAADHIDKLETDMGQITGLLAGVGTFYTRSEVLERIDRLPSVQAAWERNLGEEGS